MFPSLGIFAATLIGIGGNLVVQTVDVVHSMRPLWDLNMHESILSEFNKEIKSSK